MAWHDQPKLRDHPGVDAYLDDLDWPQQELCRELRERLKTDPDVREGIAWGVPCYFRRGPLAYTSAAKAHVTLGWFRGAEIDDPRVTGTGRSPIGKVVLKLAADFPDAAFDGWLRQAIALDDAGD